MYHHGYAFPTAVGSSTGLVCCGVCNQRVYPQPSDALEPALRTLSLASDLSLLHITVPASIGFTLSRIQQSAHGAKHERLCNFVAFSQRLQSRFVGRFLDVLGQPADALAVTYVNISPCPRVCVLLQVCFPPLPGCLELYIPCLITTLHINTSIGLTPSNGTLPFPVV